MGIMKYEYIVEYIIDNLELAKGFTNFDDAQTFAQQSPGNTFEDYKIWACTYELVEG